MFSVVCVRLSFHIGAREGVPPYSEASCNYHPQTKMREGNVFTSVCHSVHRGKVYTPGKTLSPLGRHPPSGQTPPIWPLKRAVRILLECSLVFM